MLTPVELKLIRGLLDPKIQNMNDTARIKAIGISRRSYYEGLKNPRIIKIINEQSLALLREEALPLIKQSLKFAKESRSNFQDRKMLYQMLGFLGDESTTVNVNVEEKKNPYDGLSLEELQALAKNYISAEFKEVGEVE